MRHHPLLGRDVFAEVEGLARRVDALFDASHDGGTQTFKPAFDVRETEAGWRLVADLPGVDPASLDIHQEGDQLVVKGEAAALGSDLGQVIRRERRDGAFERRIRFARSLDAEGITARLVDGVLTVDVPRRAPTRIPVTVDVGA